MGCHPQVATIVDEVFQHYPLECTYEYLRLHVDQFFKKNFNYSARFYSIANESIELLTLLVLIRTNLNDRDFENDTPLIFAIKNKSAKTVQFLLDEDVDITIPCANGILPIQYALIMQQTNILKMLLTKRFKVTFTEDIDVVKFLLDNKREFMMHKTKFSPLLYYSAMFSDDAFHLVLSKCSFATVNSVGPRDRSLIELLIKLGRKKMISSLLPLGLDINLKGIIYTPLIYAVDKYPNMAHFLLKNGANANLCVSMGIPPIHVASHNMTKGLIKLLIRYGADINAKTPDGKTPLHRALEYLKENIIDFLLFLKADVNAVDIENNTPLQLGFAGLGQFLIPNNCTLRLLATIAIMRDNKDYVSEKNINFIEKNQYLGTVYKYCEDELRRMKMKKFVNGSKLKLSDFLTSNLEKLTTAARNKEETKILKKRIHDFPIYTNVLKMNIERASWRLGRIEGCFPHFSKKVIELPFFIFDSICGYLGDNDLENLAHSVRNVKKN